MKLDKNKIKEVLYNKIKDIKNDKTIINIIKKRKGKDKFNLLIIIFLLALSIFGTPLHDLTGIPFNYADDLLTVYIIIVCLYKLISKKYQLEKNDTLILIILTIINIVGIIGNLISGYQTSLIGIMVDFLGWQKFVVAYLGFKMLTKKEKLDEYYQIIFKISKVIIVVSVIFEVLNLLDIVHLAPGHDRYGIGSFSIMGHPSSASAIMAFIICCLLLKPKENIKWLTAAIIIELATLRMKAFAFVLAIPISYFLFKDSKNLLKKITLFAIMMLIVSAGSIKFYFLDPEASRAMALNASVNIANDYFPIGSGFATFGTNMSGKFYSKAYIEYGLSNRYGFTPTAHSFAGDGGWATIIGQFGYIGTLCYLVIIIMMCKCYINKKTIIAHLLPLICLMEYFLISSTNEPAINNSYILFIGLFIALFEKKYNSQKGDINDKEVKE